MDNVLIVVIVVVLVLVLVAVVAAVLAQRRKKRSQELRGQFGPEYDRTVEQRGDRRTAEHDLAERQERHEELRLRELDPARREQFVASWQRVQARFVDEPVAAVADGQSLVREVMAERGYPTDDVQATDDVSVDHPDVVQDYRTATQISEASAQGRASTEDLREAMVRYRAIFDRLLGTGDVHDGAGRPEGDVR